MPDDGYRRDVDIRLIRTAVNLVMERLMRRLQPNFPHRLKLKWRKVTTFDGRWVFARCLMVCVPSFRLGPFTVYRPQLIGFIELALPPSADGQGPLMGAHVFAPGMREAFEEEGKFLVSILRLSHFAVLPNLPVT